MADITSFVSSFVSQMVNLFIEIYGTLDGIQFYGFSLLDFTISLFLLGLVVPIIMVLVPGRAVGEIRRGANTISRESRK